MNLVNDTLTQPCRPCIKPHAVDRPSQRYIDIAICVAEAINPRDPLHIVPKEMRILHHRIIKECVSLCPLRCGQSRIIWHSHGWCVGRSGWCVGRSGWWRIQVSPPRMVRGTVHPPPVIRRFLDSAANLPDVCPGRSRNQRVLTSSYKLIGLSLRNRKYPTVFVSYSHAHDLRSPR